MLSLVVLFVGLQLVLSAPLPAGQEAELTAYNYLQKFGYLESAPLVHGAAVEVPKAVLSEAIKRFQAFVQLPVTGVADELTIQKMAQPRCGVADNAPAVGKTPRYVLQGSKWPKRTLSWGLSKPTTQVSRAEAEEEIAKALKLWSDKADLAFIQQSGTVDLDVSFVKGNHGDGNSFDGPRGVLAHAYFPAYGGDAHFDDAETWALKDEHGPNGIHLLTVAAHEFGHSLGLSHSNNQAALMAPYYAGYTENLELHADDVAGIRAIYGTKQ